MIGGLPACDQRCWGQPGYAKGTPARNVVRIFGSKINRWVSLVSASRITETGRVIFVAQKGQHFLANTHRDRCPKGQLNRSAIRCTEPRELGFRPKKGDVNIDRGGEGLGSGGDHSFSLCRDFGSHPAPSLSFFGLRNVVLFSLTIPL